MTDFTEETLAELITALPPPPQGWVESAVELPRARAAIDELVVRATADREARELILADLERALRGEGVQPRAHTLDRLRVRLSRLEE
jgi:hypothetical protein